MGWVLLGLASNVAKFSFVKVSMASCFDVDYLSFVVCCVADMKYDAFLWECLISWGWKCSEGRRTAPFLSHVLRVLRSGTTSITAFSCFPNHSLKYCVLGGKKILFKDKPTEGITKEKLIE